MKITIHSIDELRELSLIVAHGLQALDAARPRDQDATVAIERLRAFADATGGPFDAEVPAVAPSVETAVAGTSEALRKGNGLDQVNTPENAGPSLPDVGAAAPAVDSTGRPWDERVDSSNKGLNKDGTWRARKNNPLDAAAIAQIKADLLAGVAQDTPAATETHPLPGDAQIDADAEEVVEVTPVAMIDLDEVIAGAKLIAGDQKDGQLAVLDAAKVFVADFGTDAWNDLAAAVVPNKTIMAFDPGERRLILGAVEVYRTMRAGGDA